MTRPTVDSCWRISYPFLAVSQPARSIPTSSWTVTGSRPCPASWTLTSTWTTSPTAPCPSRPTPPTSRPPSKACGPRLPWLELSRPPASSNAPAAPAWTCLTRSTTSRIISSRSPSRTSSMPWTFNVKQVMKCCVGILTPDGRAIPFCAYNSVGYREQIREQLTQQQGRHGIRPLPATSISSFLRKQESSTSGGMTLSPCSKPIPPKSAAPTCIRRSWPA